MTISWVQRAAGKNLERSPKAINFVVWYQIVNLKKILLPVDFPNPSLGVIHQAATLARHFQSEIVMMHILTALSHTAGVPEGGAELADWDLLAAIIKEARKEQDQTLGPELDGLAIQRMLVRGGAAKAIVRTAQQEKIDLIMMPCHGHTFNQFLLGSATPRVVPGTECPVWTGPRVGEAPVPKFAIRNVLCAVDFSSQDRKAVSWAVYMAAEFGARLTLAHVTAGVEFWGPGGDYVKPKWKDALVSDAAQHVRELKQEMAIQAEVFIGSGDMPKVLSDAAKQTKADLLVTGCRPYGGHLRTHGYAIICAAPIPVLNV
jgi:nucleotide-binding universal stress UspA family protein